MAIATLDLSPIALPLAVIYTFVVMTFRDEQRKVVGSDAGWLFFPRTPHSALLCSSCKCSRRFCGYLLSCFWGLLSVSFGSHSVGPCFAFVLREGRNATR